MTTSGAPTYPAPTPEALRAEFLLDPGVVFLNHGSFGACPRPVFEVYQAFQRELERQPVLFLGRRFAGMMAEARARLAAYVGAGPDEIVHVPNATTAVNIVARSLAPRWRPGDEIVTTDHEYGACDRAWRAASAAVGAVYRPVPIPVPVADADDIVERVWSAVTPRTRMLFISQITSPTALRLPVAPLVARAREAGILTLVDGAHVPGQEPLDVTALGADFYTGNGHKWLCGPKGAAFLYARAEVRDLLEPLIVSWGPESPLATGDRFIDELEFTGTRDYAAPLALPAAIDFQAERAWPAVRARCHALARDAYRRLSAIPGVRPLHPDDPAWYGQMVAFSLPTAVEPFPAMARLYDAHRIEIPIVRWNGRPVIRLSAQGYTTPAEVDALVAALPSVLPPEGD